MKDVQIYKNDLFEVGVKLDNGDIVFDAETVARCLGFEKTEIRGGVEYKSIRWRRVNDYLKSFDQMWSQVNRGDFIPEQAVYLLAMKANNETAIKFQMWLATEVIPSIRKHGAYMTDDILEKALTSPDFLIQLATNLKTERAARELAEKENKILTKENDALSSEIASWANDAIIVSLVRRYGGRTSGFAIAWKEFKACMLYKYSICIESRITHYMRKNNVKTRPRILSVLNESEMTKALKVAIVMCRSKNIDISDILGRCITEDEFNKIIEDTQEK